MGRAEGKSVIDYGFHMIVRELTDQVSTDMDLMVRFEGVTSFKLFMAYPGVFMVDDATIFKALLKTRDNGGLICMHAENGGVIDVLVQEALRRGETAPKYHALTRPTRAEGEATGRAIALAEMAGVPIYIVHLSCADALEKVKQARDMRPARVRRDLSAVPVPVVRRLRTPGVRGREVRHVAAAAREACTRTCLWRGIQRNDLQVVSTDHCPFCMNEPPQKQLGIDDFSKIPNGAPGHRDPPDAAVGGASATDASARTGSSRSSRPIRRRCSACSRARAPSPSARTPTWSLWDPEREVTLSAKTHHMRVDYNPYEGRTVTGAPAVVLSRGDVIVDRRRVQGPQGPRSVRQAAAGTAAHLLEDSMPNTPLTRPASRGMRRAAGDLYELGDAPRDSAFVNADLMPTRLDQRTWGTYHIASLWVGLSVCIPTYMLAASLVGGGMSWGQAVGTIMLGNLIVCVPMVLIAHAGTRYGIPFPVLARASFGVVGSNVPALLRSVVACGWFGIQTWIGGQAIHTMLTVAAPQFEPPQSELIGFAVFWLWNMYVVVKGSNAIKALEAYAAPFLIVAGLALLGWAVTRAGGLGPILDQPSRFATTGEFLVFFVPSLTAMVGFWATLALNIPDLSRYARSQRAQVWGQFLGLPPTMTVFAFIGVAVTSASAIVFGQAIWDPVALLSRVGSPMVVLISLVALLVATITTNVAANVVAPANGFANLWPSRITFARGGILTGVIGIAIMPWKLMENADRYMGWLITYSGFLGPIAGIFIADYWVVRRGRLALADLYAADGRYGRWNPKALVALAAGIVAALVGLAVPSLRVLYDYAWFVGFAVAFVLYALLMRGTPVDDLDDVPQTRSHA